jgi:hypothetical protein
VLTALAAIKQKMTGVPPFGRQPVKVSTAMTTLSVPTANSNRAIAAPPLAQAERNDEYFLAKLSLRGRDWWRAEAERLHIDWSAVVDLALDIIRSHCFESPFMRACREDDEQRKADPPCRPAPRPTPQTTVEAILYCVRERGPAVLKEPGNIERLRRCDKAARAEIDRRMAAYGGAR